MITITFLLVICFLVALLIGWTILPRILLISYRKRLFDIPNERKVHSQPVPRLGGLSFLPSILLAFCLTMVISEKMNVSNDVLHIESTDFLLLAAGSMILFLAGVGDDLVGMSYGTKFAIQSVSSLLLVISGNWIHTLGGLFGITTIPPVIGIILTIFVIVYILNAVNLIDGIDGLASGLSCISLASLSFILIGIGHYSYAFVAVATLGVLIPFWFYNVFGSSQRCHKLFMGDTGSLTIGFVLSFLIIHISNCVNFESEGKSLILAFSTLLVPLFDVVRVIIHRLREHRNPFLPDNNHFHHKLLRAGLRGGQVMVVILSISLFFLILNYYFCRIISITAIFIIDCLLWILIHLSIDYAMAIQKKREKVT